MRIASTAFCPPPTMYPRKPGIVLLAQDLKMLIDRLARVAKTLHRH
jgi:hypothetical protein